MVRKSYHSFQEIQGSQDRIDYWVLLLSIAFRCFVFGVFYVRHLMLDRTLFLRYSGHMLSLCLLMLVDLLSRIFRQDRTLFRYLDYLELFFFQTLSYRYPDFVMIEYFFAMTIMVDICFSFSLSLAVAQNFFFGLLWMPLMGVSYHQQIVLGIAGRAHALQSMQWGLYAIGSLACYVVSRLRHQYLSLVSLYQHENAVNHNLEVLNRTISSRLFETQTEAEQKAKREVTKYVHDNTGYIFTNLIMMMQSTEAVMDVNHTRGMAMLADCIDYGRNGMNEIRRFLREAQQDSPQRINIQSEIVKLTSLFEHCTGVTVNVDFYQWPEHFSPQIDSFFLSYVKECMTNALKHGKADEIHIICSRDKENLTSMTVQNNGQPTSGEIQYGLGLQGIRDALEALGGTLRVKHESGMFTVTAALTYTGI